jgi:hypothetical protein
MPHPPPILVKFAFGFTVLGLAVPLFNVFSLEPGSAPTHRAVFVSAWLAMVFWYFGATAVWLFRHEPEPSTIAQWLWATGCCYQLLHVAIAFHTAHGWSHAAAFAHTKAVGGFGEGVYVNYLFTGLWVGDAMWACLAPTSYQRRPRWLTVAVLGFMAFIVFNAMVVFGSWVARGIFAAFAAGVLVEVVPQSVPRRG